MKISEMSTKQAAECLCRIAEPIGRIGQDKQIAAYLKKMGERKGEPVIAILSGMVAEMVPVMLDTHYEDTIAVIAAMTGKDAAQIDGQNILETMRDAKDCIDKDLIDFFTSSAGTAGER